jgi:tetratricopeptide (TPR) repeat protein
MGENVAGTVDQRSFPRISRATKISGHSGNDNVLTGGPARLFKVIPDAGRSGVKSLLPATDYEGEAPRRWDRGLNQPGPAPADGFPRTTMLGHLSPGEEAQLNQTIEMFEVITDSQPLDYQSLEILKEAYLKLNRQRDVIRTSKRIASAYVQLGQLSSALLEYETILQRYPDDPEVLAAMAEIQTKAGSINAESAAAVEDSSKPSSSGSTTVTRRKASQPEPPSSSDEGREAMHKVLVDGRIITAHEFNQCWQASDPSAPVDTVVEPFILILADKGMVTLEKSIRAISDRSRSAFLSLEKYDIDSELARSFPKDLCRRWCVLPFDRMSKSVFVATANPFNKRAEEELRRHTANRIIWYLAAPEELKKGIEKLLR